MRTGWSGHSAVLSDCPKTALTGIVPVKSPVLGDLPMTIHGHCTLARAMHLRNFSLMGSLAIGITLLLRRDVNVMYTTSKSRILHRKTKS
jgi:hypothetical protein